MSTVVYPNPECEASTAIESFSETQTAMSSSSLYADEMINFEKYPNMKCRSNTITFCSTFITQILVKEKPRIVRVLSDFVDQELAEVRVGGLMEKDAYCYDSSAEEIGKQIGHTALRSCSVYMLPETQMQNQSFYIVE